MKVRLLKAEFNTAVKYVTKEGFTNNFPITFDLEGSDTLLVVVGFKVQKGTYTVETVEGMPCVVFKEDLKEGTEVTIQRRTHGEVPHTYQYTGNAQGGSEFNAATIDENFDHLYRVVEEVNEGFELNLDGLHRLEDKFNDVTDGFEEVKEIALGADAKSESAIKTANRADTKADGAVVTATQALGIAKEADTKSDQAIAVSDDAIRIANEAKVQATNAEESSEEAVMIAENASETAGIALNQSNTAVADAKHAVEVAEGIDGKATEALTKSGEAKAEVSVATTTANEAKAIAQGIEGKADDAIRVAGDAERIAQEALDKAQEGGMTEAELEGKSIGTGKWIRESKLEEEIAAIPKPDMTEYRKLSNNEFEGFLQVKAESDIGTGVFLVCPDGKVRGQMIYNNYGLQFAQVQDDGSSQTFTFPRYGEGGEILTDGKWITPDVPGKLKTDTFYLSESGNTKVDGVYGNDVVCSKAQENSAVVYVPHGTYYLTNSLKYPNLFFYGEGVIKFDSADFIRLGGSAGNTRLSEQYTLYYNYDSKEDVSVLKNDMSVPFSWLNDWLIDVPSVVGSTRDDLFTVRVKNGTYKVSSTPECIALSSSGNNINTEYSKQSLTWGKGSHTTKYGSRAGQRSLYVNNSTFFGAKAGASVEAGGNNCFFGFNAGQRVLSASNTIMGSVAGEWVTEGAENSYYGMGAGAHNLTGSKNVAVGNYSANHNGDSNTAIGYYAQSSIGEGKSSVGNVSVGAYARQYSNGGRNTAIGYSSGQGEVVEDYPTKNTAVDNVSIGWGSLKKISSGSSIVAIGANAMSNMKSGGDGVAVGFNSQKGTTQGACVSIGHSTLSSNITGRRNTVVGTRALSLCNSNDNTAMGYEAGSNLINGFNNTFVGEWAGNLLRSGANNTFVGRRAGSSQVSKGNNTYVGAETGTDLEDGVINSSVLGYQAKVTGDNQVQLGNASTTTYVYGTVQNRSDARDKKDIVDLSLGLDFVMQLKPRQFKWDYREWEGKNTGKRDHVGFIAQELQETLKDTNYAFVQDHSVNGGADVLSVGYDEFIGVLTKAIQEQQKLIKDLQEEVKKLKDV